MRYMRWGWPDLLACPASLVEVIIAVSRKEAEDHERAVAQARRS